LLGTIGLLPLCFHLRLEFCNAILSSPKLVQKPLRHVDCMSAVLFGDISGFAQKLKDSLPGFVELMLSSRSPWADREN
jgi:hypothetical protein